ncbi:MAG: DUF3592 domain-containing protein [Burkholderiales bacterium]
MPVSTAQFEFGPIGNKVVAALSIAVVLAALVLALWAAWRVADLATEVWRARHWPQAQASIIHVSMSNQGEPRRLGYYAMRIKYRYFHGEREFQSGRLAFTGQIGESVAVWDGIWLAKVVEYLENSRLEGRPVPIFINPSNPAETVVFRHMLWGNYVMLSLWMLLCSLPLIGVTALAARRSPRACAPRAASALVASLFCALALAGAMIASAV